MTNPDKVYVGVFMIFITEFLKGHPLFDIEESKRKITELLRFVLKYKESVKIKKKIFFKYKNGWKDDSYNI